MTEDEFKTNVKKSKRAEHAFNVALKDFHIFQPPETDIKITKGQDLSEVPEKFHQNLVTEGVMKG